MRVDFPVWGGGRRAAEVSLSLLDAATVSRLIWVPSFVDLCCDPGFPGFPSRETPESLVAAARAGGFGELVVSPRVDPVADTPEHIARMERSHVGVRLHPTGALTIGLRGEELAEVGLILRAGAVALSDGGVAHPDSLVLRNALEYTREFGVPVLLRPCDAALDAVGVVHDSPLAARLGLRGNPAATEEIGVARVIALCRATGAKVHLTHVGVARSIEAIAAAQREGLPLTASTPARNLVLDEASIDDGRYDARFRLHPPLRGAIDREALVAGVRSGVLCLSADHQPRALEERDHEFERAIPGSPAPRTAFAAALTALGDLDTVVRAFALAPREVVGLDVSSWALIDPIGERVVAAERPLPTDALEGLRLRGVVYDHVCS
ncbi:dihydroorotase [Deltaproteobacteria bacterium]|nr:dihydroorotase [Deltaproteobacteria bacterium]